jgi:hypothetical protein
MPESRMTGPARGLPCRSPDELGSLSPPRAGAAGPARRGLVRWGQVIAGVVCIFSSAAVLSALGLAVGLSAVEGDALSEIVAIGWIWAIASAAIGSFVGASVFAASAAAGRRSGAAHGSHGPSLLEHCDCGDRRRAPGPVARCWAGRRWRRGERRAADRRRARGRWGSPRAPASGDQCDRKRDRAPACPTASAARRPRRRVRNARGRACPATTDCRGGKE